MDDVKGAQGHPTVTESGGQTTVEWKRAGRIVGWTVPPGVTQATIEAWGASGGDATRQGYEGKG
eukprot:COSAG04_NODE_26386_length_295_cov_0.959184_1_plen_63_part_10